MEDGFGNWESGWGGALGEELGNEDAQEKGFCATRAGLAEERGGEKKKKLRKLRECR